MEERGLSEGIKGLIKIGLGAFILGLITATIVNAPKAIALNFATVMGMLYCVVYVATRAAYKDMKHKEGREIDGDNKIIDGH